MKTYELICDEFVVTGAFFKNEIFGSFFFTDKIDYVLTNEEYCNLRVTDNMVTFEKSKVNNYRIHKVTHNGMYVFAFAMIDETKSENIDFLTLEDLSIGSSFTLFTGGDVLEYLSCICELPNGNFIVGCVQDYISAVEKLSKKYPNKEYFYRGHYSYEFELVPSLYRKKKYYNNESFMYMDFKTQFYNELSNKKYIEILTTMQHYKMPTRLLDTTSNPLVALYMACDRPLNYRNTKYGIGEVVFMKEDKKNVKYSDSNAVTLLASLSVLETNYKQELYETIIEYNKTKDISIIKNSLAYKRFVAEVASELPYFDESFFNPSVLLEPRHVKVGMINERIIAQSGNFIIFGLCNYETGEYTSLKTVTKERIFVVHRDNIMNQLKMLNIHEGTMYPDKDHISTIIAKGYE